MKMDLLYIYIYIYTYVRVCVCVCESNSKSRLADIQYLINKQENVPMHIIYLYSQKKF